MPKKQGNTRRKRALAGKRPPAAAAAAPGAETPVPIVTRPLPTVWQLTRQAAELLWKHRRVLATIIVIYGFLNLILVRGLAGGTDVSQLKSELNQVFTGHWSALSSGVSIFVVLVGSSGNSSDQTAGAYQFILTVIASLALIWALRQLLAGHNFRARDAYYQGMRPLIPFILVLLVVGLQLIPLLVGASLYTTVVSNGIAVGGGEKIVWAVVFFVLALLSLYWLSASIIGLYISTLPDMAPMRALRSARELVRGQRWAVMRKLLYLPILLLLVAAIIMLPIIIWLTALAQWAFFVLTMVGLAAVHIYLYTLYRELLND